VLSRLDYGNATLAGLPANLLSRLQSVLNPSAWSIAGLCRSASITDNLASFHWLYQRMNLNWRLLSTELYTALHRDMSLTC